MYTLLYNSVQKQIALLCDNALYSKLSRNKAVFIDSTVYPKISRGITTRVRGGIVNLFPIQFVLNFVGDDQKRYSIEGGIITRWYNIEI